MIRRSSSLRWRKPFLGVVIVLSVIAPLLGEAVALHKSDHRFRVSGIVRDDAGKPRSDVVVVLEHKGSEQKNDVKTDRWGFYETLFHLHNANLDDEITVTVGSEVKKVPIKFDPEDVVSDRKATVDFGAPASESEMYLVYGAVGVALILGVVGYFLMRRKGKVGKKVKQGQHNRHK